MRKILEDLDRQIVLNQSDESVLLESINIYFNFVRGSNFDKRISEEIKLIFDEKKSNKTYFFQPPKQNFLKAIGYNQIIHILIRKLWDEEDFFRIAKNPSQIAFINIEVADIHSASVGLTEIQKFIANQSIFPFISGDISFFSRPASDQARKGLQWVKSGNSVTKFLERIRLIGAYVQTVFFGSQRLFEIAKSYESEIESASLIKVPNKKSFTETEVNLVALITPGIEDYEFPIDFPLLVDILLYEIKNLFKTPNLVIQTGIKELTLKLKIQIPQISESYTTLVYLLMKEIAKSPDKTESDFNDYFLLLEEKLKINFTEIKTLYHLIGSEKEPGLKDTSLVDFVDFAIADTESLTDAHKKILKSLFGNIPKEVKANHFYSIREKLKIKIEDPVKRKMIDSITEFIHVRIRENRMNWASKQFII
jgi:hypothetical protein